MVLCKQGSTSSNSSFSEQSARKWYQNHEEFKAPYVTPRGIEMGLGNVPKLNLAITGHQGKISRHWFVNILCIVTSSHFSE